MNSEVMSAYFSFLLFFSLCIFPFDAFCRGGNETDSLLYPENLSSRSVNAGIEKLVWIKVDTKEDQDFLPVISDLIRHKQIGGIIFSGNKLDNFLPVVRAIGENGKNDFLVGMNAEGGIEKQLNPELDCFPSNDQIASIADAKLQKDIIEARCLQLKSLGIQVDVSSFTAEETNRRMNLLFAAHGIFIASDKKNWQFLSGKDEAARSDTLLSPRLFRVNKNLEGQVDSFVKRCQIRCQNDPGNSEILRQYLDRIRTVKQVTQREHTKIAGVDSVLSGSGCSRLKILKHKAYRYGVTVLKNSNSLLPITGLGEKKIACLTISDTPGRGNPFFQILGKYAPVDRFNFLDSVNSTPECLLMELDRYDCVIVGSFLQDTNDTTSADKLIRLVSSKKETVVCSFGKFLSSGSLAGALLYSPASDSVTQSTASQIIFGGISAKARLPFSLPGYSEGSGINTRGSRLEYTIPEMAGVNGIYLYAIIDSAANMAIRKHAFPGCQVLVAKDRKVIYHRSFGYHTYYKKEKVKNDDIYDLASVTKITGTLPAIMKFVDQKKIDLDAEFSSYWKDFKNTDKENLSVREILAHQAGLQPWIPYWRNTVDKTGNFLPDIFQTFPDDTFSLQVSPRLFLNKNYREVMFRQIRDSPVSYEKKYVYSGLPFYLFPEIIRDMTGQEYPDYVKQAFYRPLGAYNLTFNAYNVFPPERIIPTEYDDYFRFCLLHGFVDDEGAAMMGGISGNAGLFSDANDLAKLMQMYLQMGEYGGQRFISEKTMREFTRYQYPDNNNRRGLVFDKPKLGNDTLSIEKCYPAYAAAPSSFGHSGYTGTFVWCDPDCQLVYIFLSNRVYPTRQNGTIYDTHVRMIIHQGIYDAIKKFKE